jgi:hypothetical protein
MNTIFVTRRDHQLPPDQRTRMFGDVTYDPYDTSNASIAVQSAGASGGITVNTTTLLIGGLILLAFFSGRKRR